MVLNLIQRKGTKGERVLFLNKHTEGGRKGWGQGGKKEGKWGEEKAQIDYGSLVLFLSRKKNPKQNRTEAQKHRLWFSVTKIRLQLHLSLSVPTQKYLEELKRKVLPFQVGTYSQNDELFAETECKKKKKIEHCWEDRTGQLLYLFPGRRLFPMSSVLRSILPNVKLSRKRYLGQHS